MGMPVLSDQVIDFGSDFGDFLRAHIFRLLESDDMKKCSFDEGSQVQAELEAYSEENFIPVSQKLGELLYGVMNKNIDIPPADLLVVEYEIEQQRFLALLKMNYKTYYTHMTDSDPWGNSNSVIKQKAILPGENQKLAEAALIDLTDKNGDKVQLRGMSSHGLLWYPEYTNYASIYETKKHGANMFRIAMYSDDGNGDGGYIQNPELSWKLMQAAIENTLAADMYAVVDWHVLREQNPLHNVEKAKEFFSKVSALYGDEAGVIYEICNEPNGDTTWEDIVEYASQVIPVIRENASDAVILVGTPDYSYSITKVKKDALPYSDLMYSYHFYAGQYDSAYKNMIEDCQKDGIPIFVSEWGINTEQGGQDALKQGTEFADYLNQNGISFAAWSLCNKDEVFSSLKPECNKYASWKEEDFTEVGKILFSALKGR